MNIYDYILGLLFDYFVIYVHNIDEALVISHKLSRLLELLQQTHNNKYLHEYCHKIHQNSLNDIVKHDFVKHVILQKQTANTSTQRI